MEKEESKIVARFAGNRYVTKADLYRFYAEKESDLKDTTLRWRIYRLKESNLLRPVSRGGGVRPLVNGWIAQLLEHQLIHHFTVFEIEKELTHPMFFYTKMEGKEVFPDPDPEIIKNYVLSKKNPVVIKPLLSRAPLQKTRNGLPIASLEKILVDLFCDKDLFILIRELSLKIFSAMRG